MTNSCPGRLSLGSDGPWGLQRSQATLAHARGLWVRPAVPGDMGPGQGTMGSTRYLGQLRPRSKGPRGRTTVLGNSGLSLKARGVDQLYLIARVWVRVPTGSTSSPRLLALVSEGLRGRPDFFGDWGQGPKSRSVE